MPPFRPPKERIDSLVNRIEVEIARAEGLEVAKPADLRAIVRTTLTENLQQEHDIEQEAMEMLRAHGQQIYEQNADFQNMLQEGKKILAKKKGFTL